MFFSLHVLLSLTLAVLSVTASPIPEGLLQLRTQSCSDVHVLFARGTAEIGILGTVVGPPFCAALSKALGRKSVAFEGIDYPATIARFLVGGDPGASITMASRVSSIAGQCPNARIVMSGYSQGAQVTHNPANRLSASVQKRVNAVVTFGDPFDKKNLPGILQDRRDTFCNTGDLICSGLPVVLAPHLAYGSDAPNAAKFVASLV
ncbi:cutinase [Cyathus striatus]|nr:cutinase [Cyathus striatus]